MALTLVKSSTISSGAAVSSQATSFASLPSAGNMIVVLVSAWRAVPGANIASVSDNQGNTYTKVLDRNGGNTGLNEVSIWYCASIGTPSGTHTVTANPTAGADNYIVVIASEVSGQDTSAPLDASTSAAISTTGDVATGTTGTLAQADEIVFIAASVSAGNANIAIDTPAGYTRIGVQQDSNTYIGFEGSHKIVSATTAVVGQWSHDNTGQDEASGVIATFKAAAGGDPISAFQHDAFQGDAFQFGAIVVAGGADATTGTLSSTLADFTVAGTGVQTFSGVGSPTLSAFTLGATGVNSFNGVGALALGAFAVGGVGAQSFAGVGSLTLGAFTLAGTGVNSFSGVGAVTLDAFSLAGVGSAGANGSSSVTLDAFSLGGVGAQSFSGVGAVTLGDFTLAGAGEHTGATATTGALDATLGDFTLSGAGEQGSATGASQDFRNVLDGPGERYWLDRKKRDRETREKRDKDRLEALEAELADLARIETPQPEADASPAKVKAKPKRAKASRKPAEPLETPELLAAKAEAELQAALVAALQRQYDEEAAIILLLTA